MEESKELQGFYKIFRAVVYVSVLLEFFEYAIDPAVFDQWGGILTDIHGRIKRWTIYQDGHLVYSKIVEKPRDFDPFGQTGFGPLWLQYD